MARKYQTHKKVVVKKTRAARPARATAATAAAVGLSGGGMFGRAAAFAERNMLAISLLFFAVALIIRVTYVFSLRSLPLFDSLVMDPARHEKLALMIYNGDWLAGDEPFIRSPLYVYLLGVLYKIFEHGYLAPRLFGALMGAANVFLIMRLGNKLFGALPACIAGLIAVFYWPLIYFDGEMHTTTFTIFMGLILLLVFVRVWQRPSAGGMIVLGLFFGLAAITRENYFPIIGVAWLFFVVAWRQFWRPAVFFAAALLAVSPITIRNYLAFDDFVPIAYYTTVNFYIGNNPYADGRTAIVPYTRADWYGGREDVGNIVAKHTGVENPSPSQISTFWGKETFKYIFNDFLFCDPETMTPTPTLYDEEPPPPRDGKCRAFLPNAIKKFFFVFDLREYSNNKEMYFFRSLSWVLDLPIFSLFAGFLSIPFGLLGIFFAARARNRAAVPLYVILVGYLIGLSLGFVNSRIRMPVIVMFIVFTGYALARLWKMWTARERDGFWRGIGLAVAVAALSLVINAPTPGHRERATMAGHFMMGNAYVRKGELDTAEKHYQESVKLTVGEYQMRTLAGLAEIELQRGIDAVSQEDFETALTHFRKSLEYRPSYQVYVNIGNVLASLGEDPLPYLQEALNLSPGNPHVYVSFSQYYLSQRNVEEARRYLSLARQTGVDGDQQLGYYLASVEQQLRAVEGGAVDGGGQGIPPEVLRQLRAQQQAQQAGGGAPQGGQGLPPELLQQLQAQQQAQQGEGGAPPGVPPEVWRQLQAQQQAQQQGGAPQGGQGLPPELLQQLQAQQQGGAPQGGQGLPPELLQQLQAQQQGGASQGGQGLPPELLQQLQAQQQGGAPQGGQGLPPELLQQLQAQQQAQQAQNSGQ